MVQVLLKWMRANRKSAIAVTASLVGFVLLNAVAFFQARAMTHFTEGGVRTQRPQSLSTVEKIRTLLLGVNVPKPRNVLGPSSFGLAYETERFASEGDGELEAWRVPCARSRGLVLLFHGYASSKSSLLPVARELHGMGFETFLVDFRGSGGSSGAVTTLGVHEADDVAKAVERATSSSEHKAPILYGVSMGSVAILRAIHAARVHPRAILIECPFSRLLDTVKARFALMGVPSFPCAELLVFWGGAQFGFNGFEHGPVEYARSVTCPTLLMQGDADSTVTVEQAQEIFDHLAGPKTLKTFHGVGHESYLGARADEWRAAVARSLEAAERE